MDLKKTVLLIMGSTRAGRICPKIAEWIAQIGAVRTDFAYEIIDLAEWHLPMNDEPAIPALGPYTQAHTHAWSEKIKAADGVVFVTPQYNWGYPSVLKNAIDHLYREWHGKPAAIVSYGGHGGGKCAKQLKQVVGAVKMRLVSTMPGIVLPEAVIREGVAIHPDHDFKKHRKSIESALAKLAALISP